MDLINALIVGLVGLSFGSFITMASFRLPRGEDIVRKGSRCPACEHGLGVRDLFPVLSWAMSRAQCRYCHARVHWRYPLIELITAALFLMIYARYGLTVQSALLAVFVVALLIICVIDFEHYLIPDGVQLFLLPLGFAYQFHIQAAMEYVAVGTGFGLMLGLALRYGYQLVRRQEGLGWGDVKFLAVVGAWLPVTQLPLMMWVPFLFFSGLFGVGIALVWRVLDRGPVFPFGPALALALFMCVLYPEFTESFWNLQRMVYQ